MSHRHRQAKSSSEPGNGTFATLSNLLPARESSAPSSAGLGARKTPSPRRLALTTTLASLIALGSTLALTAAPSAWAACPNEALRAQQGSTALPDCRAYELVSPPGLQKNGADALGTGGKVAASPDGSSFFYFSLMPFAGIPSSPGYLRYLSTRSPSPASWSLHGVFPPLEPNAGAGITSWTEDTRYALLSVGSTQDSPSCEPEASICTPSSSRPTEYLIDTATGAFRFIAELPEGGNIWIVSASAGDSRLLLESRAQLLPAARAGKDNLYAFDPSTPPGQRLRLVGLLPASEGGEAPAQGSAAGSGAGFSTSGPVEGSNIGYTQRALSADGSRAFFSAPGTISAPGTGPLYERLLDAEPERTVRVSPGNAVYREATPDGLYVFYTEAGGLYRFDTETEATVELAAPSAEVQGVLGVSADGTTAYFDAEAVLTGTERNEWGSAAESGAANLYGWHEDSVTHAASSAFLAGGIDPRNWALSAALGHLEGPADGQRASRLTPSASVLLFLSSAHLTSYDNRPPSGECEPEFSACPEFYRYDSAAPTGARLSCVTCNPTGARPIATPQTAIASNLVGLATPSVTGPLALTRNLSADGKIVFFQTREPLLPADLNGQTDVYEWEFPGSGSCAESSAAFSVQDAGCLFLLSAGTSPQQSNFGDASASGEDAFFFTRQRLVSQDTDNNLDLYDARALGGIAAQNLPPSGLPCEAEACRPPVTTLPAESTPASESLVGLPNATYCKPGFVKKHGTCVRKPKPRRHRKHRRHARAHRRANRNGGGGK